jgi:superkiller protein 3
MSQNVVFWSNLGLLYLFNNDLELAQETFRRVQTLDPDYAIAWIGQAVIASASGHPESAFALLEHAITLASPAVCCNELFFIIFEMSDKYI